MTTATALEPAMPIHEEGRLDQIPLTKGDRFRRLLATLLPLIALGGAIHMTYNVRWLVIWFPACLIVGVALEFAVLPTRSWRALLFAVIPSAGAILCATLISAFEWRPREAQLPISLLWWSFTIAILAMGVPANRAVWSYRRRGDACAPFRWQFPLRLILALMVVVSVVLALLKLAMPQRQDFLVFGYGAAAVFLVVGIAFSLFLANLKDNGPTASTNPWDDVEVPAPVDSPTT